jgi:hypothetical protein
MSRARRLGAALSAFDRRDLETAAAELAALSLDAPDDREIRWLAALVGAARQEPVDPPEDPTPLSALIAAAIFLARGDVPGAWARLAGRHELATALRMLPDPTGSFARDLALRTTRALAGRLAAVGRGNDAIAAAAMTVGLDPARSDSWRRLERLIVACEPIPADGRLPGLRASLARDYDAAALIRAARILARDRPVGVSLDMAGLRHMAGTVIDAAHADGRPVRAAEGHPAFVAVDNLTVMRTRYGNGDVGFWPWTGDGAFVAFGVPVGERGPMAWMPHVAEDGRYVVGRVPARWIDVPGRHIVLGGRNNHYHFLIDYLPSMLLAARDPCLEGLPMMVQDDSLRQIAAAALFGVPASRFVTFDALRGPAESDTGLRFASAWHALDLPLEMRARLLRTAMPTSSGNGPRRIMIRRDDGGRVARRLENEDEIAEALTSRGFATLAFGGLDMTAQLAAVADADVVVGAHGAALANIVFMKPGARVVELLNQPTADAPAFLVYQRLAALAGLEFRRVVGQTLDRPMDASFPPNQPFRCAVDDVLTAVS